MKRHYLSIQEVTYGESVPAGQLRILLESEVLDAYTSPEGMVFVAEKDCEECRALLRLLNDLELNVDSLAAIFYLRQQVNTLQAELALVRGSL